MADFIQFKRVEIGPENLCARVVIGKDAPLYTSEDLEGTTRVYNLLPDIINHVCLGDAGETFKDVMGDTELAHLLEHVAVELLAQTNIAGDIASGRTKAVPDEEDAYDIQLSCPDDVLVVGALSSAAWILQWAYTDGSEPAPDIDAIVSGLVSLVESLPAPQPVEYEEAEELEEDEPAGVEIPDFIRQAAARRINEEPVRSPEAVQADQDELGEDDEVMSDEYVFDGYVVRDEEPGGEDVEAADGAAEEEAAEAPAADDELAAEEQDDAEDEATADEDALVAGEADEISAIDDAVNDSSAEPEGPTDAEPGIEPDPGLDSPADAEPLAGPVEELPTTEEQIPDTSGDKQPASTDAGLDAGTLAGDDGAAVPQEGEAETGGAPAGEQVELPWGDPAGDEHLTDGVDEEGDNVPGSRPVR